jgi:peroxiredoxin
VLCAPPVLSPAMIPGLSPGDRFLDMELTDHVENQRRLSEVTAGDPMVLTFCRGFWWPKEQQFMRQLVQLQDQAEVACSRIVSVTLDSHEVIRAFRAGVGARWTILSDAEPAWLQRLDLDEKTDSTNRPYVPTVFPLYPDLTIESVHGGGRDGRPSKNSARTGGRSTGPSRGTSDTAAARWRRTRMPVWLTLAADDP